MAQTQGAYYVPHGSHWPIFGSLGMLGTLGGAALWMDDFQIGKLVMAVGIALMIVMFIGWFHSVITESVAGKYNKQVDVSFRLGMIWFIFSEVMFFGAFFGALFYTRMLSIPWLGGMGHGGPTNEFLWPAFTAAWPSNGPDAIGGDFTVMSPWGIPLLNTLLLLSSGITLTIAHHALRVGHRARLLTFLGLTVVLGAIFLGFQVYEYYEAYHHYNLTLGSGIYGSTFFMLTGFHGAHVTLGAIMLCVIWARSAAGHFSRNDHFGFEAVAWYWHFVDVVWLGLFVFVYVL
ncbi:MAG: cytochrome c oxidase subunit 3 [Xanthomonadales bacterium]|nr:cytochrome c oxidase subunit 3 [Xanthomonadales bacterium]